MIDHNDTLFRIVISILGLLGYSYLFFRQLGKLQNNRDAVTPLRAIILSVFFLALVTFIPSIINQLYIYVDAPNELWRKVSLYTTSVNQMATLILIIVFANYKLKDQ